MTLMVRDCFRRGVSGQFRFISLCFSAAHCHAPGLPLARHECWPCGGGGGRALSRTMHSTHRLRLWEPQVGKLKAGVARVDITLVG